jgi:hypothetical protein
MYRISIRFLIGVVFVAAVVAAIVLLVVYGGSDGSS